jgi:hypothetical protein
MVAVINFPGKSLLKIRLKPFLLLLVIRSINGTAMTKIHCRLALANGQFIRKNRL